MRVLMIAPEPFFDVRGTPISVYQRLHALSTLGYDVDLLTYHLGLDIDIPGVTIRRIPRVPFVGKIKIGPSWTKLLLDALLFATAVGLLLRNRYDIIHSHEEAAFLATLLAEIFRTRHVYDMHSRLPRQMSRLKGVHYKLVTALFGLLEKRVLHTCDAVITIGPDLEEYVRAINPETKLLRIGNLPIQICSPEKQPYPVDELRAKFQLKDRLPIVYTGNLEPYQGIELLIGCARRVVEVHPEALFLLVGGTPDQVAHWQKEVEQERMNDYTVFTGNVPLPEALAFLEVAEILVSPRSEGMPAPLKVYTYLQAGKPIIATDVSAHRSVLDSECGLLVAPESGALAEGLSRLIEDPEWRDRLGQQARTRAARQPLYQDYVAKLAEVYRMALPPNSANLDSFLQWQCDVPAPRRDTDQQLVG